MYIFFVICIKIYSTKETIKLMFRKKQINFVISENSYNKTYRSCAKNQLFIKAIKARCINALNLFLTKVPHIFSVKLM